MIRDTELKLNCYHCGEDCKDEHIHIQEKQFCCQGCKTVYQILNKVELCDYYRISEKPGISQKDRTRKDKFAFLDDEALQNKLIRFKDGSQTHILFYLPQMHCSSCIWLLEHLSKLDKDIVQSQVNFLKKEVTVVFDHKGTSVRKVAELLTSIGYEPHFSLNNLTDKKTRTYDKGRIYKIGITGFCFGNIMLLSFPEYFSNGNIEEKGLKELFSYLNIILSLPVFFYGASEFFVSAWKSIKQKLLNIDAPIALAVLITFARSIYEILSGTGAGYLDSMSGIVFFMLIGRFFQNKTYNTLAFNRDYTSYFPLGVTAINTEGMETQVPISDLKVGQRIKVYSQEIIPADCILFMGNATIDYSFVSGEALPITKNIGEIIYAGGKQLGGALEMEVVKEVSQSYLTQLWSNDAFKRSEETQNRSYIHVVSRYFTLVLFSIAFITGVYWHINDPSKLWNAVTSILIVACPCALLLSASFTNGNMLRVLQKFGFYARNANVIEQIGETNTIVFDKTGTITEQQKSTIEYIGENMDAETQKLVRTLACQSSHPLSKAITQFLPLTKTFLVKHYEEIKGQGIKGIIGNTAVQIGSASFVNKNELLQYESSRAYVKINEKIMGYFSITTLYRKGMEKMLSDLKRNYITSLLSGDNEAEHHYLKPLFNSDLRFDQLPIDKLNYIKKLQDKNEKVIMIGDGLNDAGALKQSNVGIVITDDVNNFSPACDVIMKGRSFPLLEQLINYCRKNKFIINITFVISILYNIIGLSFAIQGNLQPVTAAILMPVSSISIVLITTGLSSVLSMSIERAVRLNSSMNARTDKGHVSH